MELLKTENWATLNQQIHQMLKVDPENSVRIYRGIHHAAFELGLGTALFLSHKRSVGWLQGQSYGFQTVLPHLYKEGFQVQKLAQKSPELELTTWLESLKKDTSFVLSSEDNPVTGEYFETEKLDQFLNDKKIFSIAVSHYQHYLKRYAEVRPYSVKICQFSPDLAVAICGARFKSPIQISSHLSWDIEGTLEKIAELLRENISDESLIKKFEKQIAPHFETPFSKLEKRSYLFTQITDPEFNGEAIVHELLKLCPEVRGLVFPMTSCHQGFVDWSWWDQCPQPDFLRGMIAIYQMALKIESFQASLLEAKQACLL